MVLNRGAAEPLGAAENSKGDVPRQIVTKTKVEKHEIYGLLTDLELLCETFESHFVDICFRNLEVSNLLCFPVKPQWPPEFDRVRRLQC